jgi:hypothetical protein
MHTHMDDDVRDEGDIRDSVRRMKNGKAPGPSGMKAEHLKEWLDATEREIYPEWDRWSKFIELIQHVLETGVLPIEIAWYVMVVIPKGSGSYRGTGLMEVAWKVISSIIDIRLKDDVKFHESLHEFRSERGT